jgi:hypothetical protein
VSREKELYQLTDNPIRICATTHERTPYISNRGESDIILSIAKWPVAGLTLQPGVTVPFVNPGTPADATQIFASAPTGRGVVETLFLK